MSKKTEKLGGTSLKPIVLWKKKIAYLNRIYSLARAKVLCKKQGDFTALLGMNASTISGAMQGKDKYLIENFMRRVRTWAQQVGLEEEAKFATRTPGLDRISAIREARTYLFYRELRPLCRLSSFRPAYFSDNNKTKTAKKKARSSSPGLSPFHRAQWLRSVQR